MQSLLLSKRIFGSRVHHKNLGFEEILENGPLWGKFPATFIQKNESSVDLEKLSTKSFNKVRRSKEHIHLRTGLNMQEANTLRSMKRELGCTLQEASYLYNEDQEDVPYDLDFAFKRYNWYHYRFQANQSAELTNLFENMSLSDNKQCKLSSAVKPAYNPSIITLKDIPTVDLTYIPGPDGRTFSELTVAEKAAHFYDRTEAVTDRNNEVIGYGNVIKVKSLNLATSKSDYFLHNLIIT